MNEREPMHAAEITVTIPPDSRFVALARVTAASLAAELDFTVDEVEDLTVGANELVALFIDRAVDLDADRVDLEFRVGGDRLELLVALPVGQQPVDGSSESAAVPDASAAVPDPLAERILRAVVDEFELGATSGRIVKVRSTS